MFYTNSIIAIASDVNSVGEFVEWNFDASNYVVVKLVEGVERMQFPAIDVVEAVEIYKRHLV